MTINQINQLEPREFEKYFAGVLEHSPHYAKSAAQQRPFTDFDDLLKAFESAVLKDDPSKQLELIRAHPDLAGKAAIAGELTVESAGEQKSAGLDRLTPEEFAEFTRVNQAYRAKFSMPYIVCVRENTKATILEGSVTRLEHDLETEIQIALGEIVKIAKYRLLDLVVPEDPLKTNISN